MADAHALFWGFCRFSLKLPPFLIFQVLDWITYFGHFAGTIFLEFHIPFPHCCKRERILVKDFSITPLLLDVNTKATKLREVIDKIGSTLVFEDADGLEEDETATML
ncbi:hypothetical protein VPH35_140977 [Triticum aestivum]|uniref:Uncharacterized protein n=1 Tax=Aegilops tauschii TaxID=37682 RepID=M8C5E1_AEGTA